MRKKTTYASQIQLCRMLNLDPRIVAAASRLGAPGFNANRSVNWEVLEPWIKENESRINESLETVTLADIRKENAIWDGIIKQQTIAKYNRETLEPEEIENWSSDFGTRLIAEIRKANNVIKAKCKGSEVIIDDVFLDLYFSIQKGVERWKR